MIAPQSRAARSGSASSEPPRPGAGAPPPTCPRCAALRGVPRHRRVDHAAEHGPGHRGGLRDPAGLRRRRRAGGQPRGGRRRGHGQGSRARPADPRRPGGRQARVLASGRSGSTWPRRPRWPSWPRPAACGTSSGCRATRRPAALFVRELIENGDIGQPLTVGHGGRRGPGGTPDPAGQPLRHRCGGRGHRAHHLRPATSWPPWPGRSGEFRQLSGVVALVNKQTTVIETGQTVPVTAPDQVLVAGQLDSGAVASVAVQGGSAPVSPSFELRIVGTEATLVVRPATPGGIHITDWAIRLAKPDGSVADLPVPGPLQPDTRARCRPGRRGTSPCSTASSPGPSPDASRRARLRHRRPVPPAAGDTSSALRTPGSARSGRLAAVSGPRLLPIVQCGDPDPAPPG